MINTIIFDIGNVLAEFCWKKMFEEYGWTGEVFDIMANATVYNYAWEEFDKGEIPTEEIIEIFAQKAPEYKGEIAKIFEDPRKMISLFDYAEDWILELKKQGYKVYILSNWSKPTYYACLDNELRFLKHVDGAVFSFQEHVIKPDKAIYEIICSRYNINPSEAVFLDDRPANVEGAKSIGLNTILFQNYAQGKSELDALLAESNKFQMEGNLLTKYTGKDIIAEIPEGVETIRAFAFSYCSELKQVYFPSTLKTVAFNAFMRCDNLEFVSIPFDSKVTWLEGPYNIMPKIPKIVRRSNTPSPERELIIPEGVTTLETGHYYSADTLEEIQLPNTLKVIGILAFGHCTTLTHIEIPEGVTEIKDEAFRGCSALKSIKLPSTLTTIGPKAFADCTALETIDIPKNTKSLGVNVFENCKSLERVTLGNLMDLPQYGFLNCVALQEIEIPESIKIIKRHAFQGCSGLKTLKLSKGLSQIHNYAFYSCKSLKTVILPDTIERLDRDAFPSSVILPPTSVMARIEKIWEKEEKSAEAARKAPNPYTLPSDHPDFIDPFHPLRSQH